MKPALGFQWINPLTKWASIPAGERLKRTEAIVINDRLQYCFGQYMVKVGSLSCELDTPTCLINKQINLASSIELNDKFGLITEFDELAIQSNSIDAIVVSHVIEYCADPHQVLRELHRVLLPNGNMIISFFNPLSFLFLYKLWPSSKYKEFKRGRFFSVARIKDWMDLLGFEVVDEHKLFYSQIGQDKKVLDNGTWPTLMKNIFPWCAGVTVLTVKKREWPLTPIRPRLRYKTVFNPSVGRPSVNTKTKTV